MQTFKVNDKVFCPSISNQPFILHCRNPGALHIVHNDTCYRFNKQGYILKSTYFGDVVVGTVPLLLYANKENRETLSHLYCKEFVLDIDVEVYAIHCRRADKVGEWVAVDENGTSSTCAMPPKSTNLIQYLKDNNAIIGTDKKLLETIPQGYNFAVVCVGIESINNWTNKVE